MSVSTASQGVSSGQFRQLLGQAASGVAIVTASHAGRQLGTTVSSFSSISAEPPLISICLSHYLQSCAVIAAEGHFVVNLLHDQQQELGQIFAGIIKRDDRFAGLALDFSSAGAPILPNTLAWLGCEVVQQFALGDHVLFIASVVEGETRPSEHRPLLYHQRQWGGFRPIRIENGEWRMENGEWRMENGEWRMESALPACDCSPTVM